MNNSDSFFALWDRVMRIGALGSIAVGIMIFLYYELQVSRVKDYKDKYDYVSQHEIRYFWYAVLGAIIAIALFVNSIATGPLTEKTMRWFYVRLGATASFLVIAYFIFYGIVKIYYPKSVTKRLTKLRNLPRMSPAGNPMRKLSEDEEDVHLERSQIAEESVQSIDYDVWIDEKTGYKKVEKYVHKESIEECPECGYFTFIVDREELKTPPKEDQEGLLVRHLLCKFCQHREVRDVTVAPLNENA